MFRTITHPSAPTAATHAASARALPTFHSGARTRESLLIRDPRLIAALLSSSAVARGDATIETSNVEIKSWLVPMLRSWAGQKRAIWAGRNRGGDLDGFPATTVIAKIRAEREGAGQAGGHGQQYFAEVLRGDALRIARAMDGMPADFADVLHLHYLIHLPADEKARQWGWTTSHYWHTHESALAHLAGALRALDRARDSGVRS